MKLAQSHFVRIIKEFIKKFIMKLKSYNINYDFFFSIKQITIFKIAKTY